MEAKVYSPGIAKIKIYGLTFAMPEGEIRKLIRILTNVLFDLKKGAVRKGERPSEHPGQYAPEKDV